MSRVALVDDDAECAAACASELHKAGWEVELFERAALLLSRAHEAMGRILAFLDRNDEAMKEFEAAISIGEVTGGAYRDALEGKRKLGQP